MKGDDEIVNDDLDIVTEVDLDEEENLDVDSYFGDDDMDASEDELDLSFLDEEEEE